MLRTSLLALAALGLSACATESATDTAAASRDCFFASQVTGYDLIDNHHIAVNVGANRRYILTTTWNAQDLNWTQAIALRSSSTNICTGNGLGVSVIGGDPQRTYPIDSIALEADTTPVGS